MEKNNNSTHENVYEDLSIDGVDDPMARAMEQADHILRHQRYYWGSPGEYAQRMYDEVLPLLEAYTEQSVYARMAVEFLRRHKAYFERREEHKKTSRQKRKGIASNYDAIFVEIGRRDGFYCKACGLSPKDLQIDHVIPLIEGGTNEPGNLQLLCKSCNASKGDKVRP